MRSCSYETQSEKIFKSFLSNSIIVNGTQVEKYFTLQLQLLCYGIDAFL